MFTNLKPSSRRCFVNLLIYFFLYIYIICYILFQGCFLVWPNTFAILCNRLPPSDERFRYASYNPIKHIMATKLKQALLQGLHWRETSADRCPAPSDPDPAPSYIIWWQLMKVILAFIFKMFFISKFDLHIIFGIFAYIK